MNEAHNQELSHYIFDIVTKTKINNNTLEDLRKNLYKSSIMKHIAKVFAKDGLQLTVDLNLIYFYVKSYIANPNLTAIEIFTEAEEKSIKANMNFFNKIEAKRIRESISELKNLGYEITKIKT